MVSLGVVLLSACSNDMLQAESDDELTPIVFNASGITASMEGQAQTRAKNDKFPNSGKIAIVAAHATSAVADWNSLFMDHAGATAANEDAERKHSVTIDGNTPYYWPFNPDEYLSFVAYSPKADNMLSICGDRTKLRVAPAQGITTFTYPDLLCTTVIGPQNKTKSSIELPFEHAMAQIEINVIAIDDKGNEFTPSPAISITSLTLDTKIAGGTFDLASNSWSLDTPAKVFSTFCTLITNDDIPKKGVSYLLLPGTEADVQVTITMSDASGATVTESYAINEFKTSGTSAILERSKKSVLTIKVKPKDISTGNTDAIILQGDLAPWDYKGESKVTIE